MTRKVRPREMWRPPSASDHNAMAAAADMYRRGPAPAQSSRVPPSGNYVTIRNDSGTARRQFDVLKIDADFVLSDVTRESVYVNGIEPDGSGPYAILLQPIEDESFGLAQVAGICPAYVSVSAITDTSCNVASGGYTLTSGSGPFELVQQPGSTGEQLCIVRFGYTPSDIRLWRVTYGNATTTAAVNDFSTYWATTALGRWTPNKYVAIDTTAKTITFLSAGYYTIGVQLRVANSGGFNATSDLQFNAQPGVFRQSGYSLVFTSVGDISTYMPTTPWIYQHDYGFVKTGFAESYLTVNAGDILGCRITRTGTDLTTNMTALAVITIGPVWQNSL